MKAVSNQNYDKDLYEEFDSIVISQSAALKSFALKMTNDEDEAEDLLQDTLLKAFRFFSRTLKEIPYGDINNISVTQGNMQKRLKIGNLTIVTNQASHVFRGIKNPHKTKELINKEKYLEHERRTLLRKIL